MDDTDGLKRITSLVNTLKSWKLGTRNRGVAPGS